MITFGKRLQCILDIDWPFLCLGKGQTYDEIQGKRAEYLICMSWWQELCGTEMFHIYWQGTFDYFKKEPNCHGWRIGG